jgi:2-phospho-L-lactate guanylyltransferase (CobY/MobA/RfbA family)
MADLLKVNGDAPVILVPFRESSAKSRLPEQGRVELAHAMLDDVVAACSEIGEVIVVTAPLGLGIAVAAALAMMPARPVLIVNADVPAVTPRDLQEMFCSVPHGGLALVEAEDGTTNALALSSPALFRPLYGPGSSSRFRMLAESRTLHIPNLIHDVDTVDDLHRLSELAGPRTRAVTQNWDGCPTI